MLNTFITGAVFAGLNTIGLWYSVPLTGINPSSSIWWRGFNSFEIAYSIHKLREIHPFIFPNNDTVSNEDLLLQYSVDQEQYEIAKMALERSAQAASMNNSLPGATMTDTVPSATAIPTFLYLEQDSTGKHGYAQPYTSAPADDGTFGSRFMVLFCIISLAIQVKIFDMVHDTKKQANQTHRQVEKMWAIQGQFEHLLNEIHILQKEFEWIRPTFKFLGESFEICSSDLQRCLVHVVGMMEEKYTSSMINIESKLEEVDSKMAEVSTQHKTVIHNTKDFNQIPRQLCWLNILLGKDKREGMPEELEIVTPNTDPYACPSTMQRKGASRPVSGASESLITRYEEARKAHEAKRQSKQGAAGQYNGKTGA